MVKDCFDGTVGSCAVAYPVKIIVDEKNELYKQWFSKPKHKDIVTSHFIQKHGVLSVHEDSPDGTMYRSMDCPLLIGSLYFPAGQTFAANNDYDLAVLPMQRDHDKCRLDFSGSGVAIDISNDGWVLVALGRWSEWKKKQQKTHYSLS